MEDAWLDRAIQAAQQNETARARELFRGYVRYHRQSEQGWLWFSRLVETQDERTAALQRVLEINSLNRVAANELAMITHGSLPPRKQSASIKPRKSLSTKLRREIRRAQSTMAPIRKAAPNRSARAFSTHLMWAFKSAVFGIAAVLFLVVALAAVPMLAGNRTLVILSGSMEPAISSGAAVVVQPIASRDLQIGDVIAFTPSATSQIPVVHRIVGIREKAGVRYFVTRGDANPGADAQEISLPPIAWRFWYGLPWVGYLITFTTSPAGQVLLIVVPVVGWIIASALDWLKKTRLASRLSPM